MIKFPDIREVDEWVVVERSTNKKYVFATFKEALKSPVKGHVMTNQFYTYHYEK